MKQTAIIVAPGRGTYNKTELGYLSRYHSDKSDLIQSFDEIRKSLGQKSITELDRAEQFSGSIHTRGDNASALIYACAYSDFLSIDRERFDILGITGNSMGWYIALACAGVLDSTSGMMIANTMGNLMQKHLIGGQIIYPYTNDNWEIDIAQRGKILDKARDINTIPNHVLSLSIDLGGLLVLAGNEAGLKAFESVMPVVQERFPMRLPNHAGFHTHLQEPVSKLGMEALSSELFQQPKISLVDGRGFIWNPKASDLTNLYNYTLGYQVIEPYYFNAAIKTSAREFMPDVFIVLGPGTTLSSATAHSLISANWHNWNNKQEFVSSEKEMTRLLVMGKDEHRQLVCR
jgi:[acyl-carrier-protein] S-malonyltransferase